LAAQTDQPEDLVTAQLWRMVRGRLFPMAQVVAAVELLGQLNWTTMVTEQQHGSLAALHRVHLDYSLQTLITRAHLLQLHRLLPKCSENEKRLRALGDAIARQLRARLGQVQGRNLYIKVLCELLRDQQRDLHAAADDLGMSVLLEAHDEAEMVRALGLPSPLMGVNNRDLKTFTVDLAITERLAARAPKDALLVTESGLFTAADAARLESSGARAMLVGESLMRQADVEAATRALLA
jgi:hypothetical protein